MQLTWMCTASRPTPLRAWHRTVGRSSGRRVNALCICIVRASSEPGFSRDLRSLVVPHVSNQRAFVPQLDSDRLHRHGGGDGTGLATRKVYFCESSARLLHA